PLSLAGINARESCYHEAAKFALCYGPMRLLAPLRLGRLLSSFHLLGHPWGASSITTRANNQFPWPDFHRLDKQPYRLQAKDTKSNEVVTKISESFMAFEYQRWRGASVSFSTTLRLCHSSMECRLTGMSPDTSCEPGCRQSMPA